MSEQQKQQSQQKPWSNSQSDQDWLAPLTKTRFDLPAKYRKKRHSYYFRWLKLNITSVYSFSTTRTRFSIPRELHLCNVVEEHGELGKVLDSFTMTPVPQSLREGYSKRVDDFIGLFQLGVMRGAFSFTDKFISRYTEPMALVDSVSLSNKLPYSRKHAAYTT